MKKIVFIVIIIILLILVFMFVGQRGSKAPNVDTEVEDIENIFNDAGTGGINSLAL